MEEKNNPYREIESKSLVLKIYVSNTEHSMQYGIKAKKPLFLKELYIAPEMRNKGNGNEIIGLIEQYAIDNDCDLIFGHIPKKAEFTNSDEKLLSNFSPVEMIKNWLHKKGYSVNMKNNDFYKNIKKTKPLTYFGGEGFDSCEEAGEFEIITDGFIRKFNNLSSAKAFYESLNVDKSFWDLKTNTLLDSRFVK